jgi:hypothetical protein
MVVLFGRVAGKWDLNLEAARRQTDDGGSVSRSARQILLDVITDNAKATATLTAKSGPGEPWTLSGTWQQNRLEMASDWRDISITNNGNPGTGRARFIVRLTLSGEKLDGTCEFAFENGEPLPQRCTGQRAK